jgi:predicted negative regulator of RcsB-dependent stress response
MSRSKWLNFLLPTIGSAVGQMAFGFTGMLLGPIVVAAVMLGWRHWQTRAGDADAEVLRFREFVANAAKNAPPNPAAGSAAALPSAAPRKPGFEEIKARAAALEGDSLAQAQRAAREALARAPRDAHAALEVALLVRRASPARERLAARSAAAAQAIALCLANGLAPVAAAMFIEALDERAALKLEPSQWDALGRALLARGAHLEAAWSLHAGAALAGDAAAAQKRLVEVAGKAAEAGRPAVAHKLYETLLAKYPDSQYAGLARAELRAEEKKLGKG